MAYHSDRYVWHILSNEALWGMDLTKIDGLLAQVEKGLQLIEKEGVRRAVQQANEEALQVEK